MEKVYNICVFFMVPVFMHLLKICDVFWSSGTGGFFRLIVVFLIYNLLQKIR